MILTIPKKDREGLQRLFDLSSSGWGNLFDGVKKTTPVLPISTFSKNLAENLSADVEDIRYIVGILTILISLVEDYPGTEEQLFEHLHNAIKDPDGPALEPSKKEWELFRENISKLYSDAGPIGLITKARDVTYEEERLLVDTRIITDLRPVYKTEIGDMPEAFVVTHSLKIVTQESGRIKELYYALNSDDLNDLELMIKRARKKEQSLKRIAEKVKIPYIPDGNVSD